MNAPDQIRGIKSPELDKDFVRRSSEDLSAFLKTHYPRRAWDSEFTKEATDPKSLQERIIRSIRTLVYDPLGNVVASGAVVVSPYLSVRRVGTLERKVVPWMDIKQLSVAEGRSFTGLNFDEVLLPVEKFFGVLFHRQVTGPEQRIEINGTEYEIASGFLVEMSSYAVDAKSEWRVHAAQELYYEFLMGSYETMFIVDGRQPQVSSIISQMNDPEFSDFFFSYGEAVGRRLYRPFGFSTIPELAITLHNVEWAPLVTDGRLHSTYVNSRGMQTVARRAFNDLFMSGFDSTNGYSWLGNSMAEDVSAIFRLNNFQQKFFNETEPRLKRRFLQYSRRGQSVP